MEKWDGNEGTSAFHVPEWMVSSLVTLLFLLFLGNEAAISDRWQGSPVTSPYQDLWLGEELFLEISDVFCVLGHPYFLIASEAEKVPRAAWPESAYCLAVCAGLEFPYCCWCTAWAVFFCSCFALCKLMLRFFLMGLKRKSSVWGETELVEMVVSQVFEEM